MWYKMPVIDLLIFTNKPPLYIRSITAKIITYRPLSLFLHDSLVNLKARKSGGVKKSGYLPIIFYNFEQT